ncbi:MAG: hypothetical protein JWQ35_2539 [Bacteriovoracaceae bacterium]|nr:hypothetical protein [Bacteriovoracaceae bacterium]
MKNGTIKFKAPETEADLMTKLSKEDAPLSATDERNDEASNEIVTAFEEALGTNRGFIKTNAQDPKRRNRF